MINKYIINIFSTAALSLAISLSTMAAFGAAVADEAMSSTIRPQKHLSPVELEVWNSPEFKRQFAESYMAETEIEPRITADERDQMQEMFELISSDKIDEALNSLNKELARNEAASAVFDFTLANIYFQREELDLAAESYAIAVEKFPKFLRAWKNMGLIHIRQGAFTEALPALTRVIELGGHDAITYGLLGFAYASTDNYLAAESAYRMAILMDPATLDWKMGLARCLFKQECYGEAAALCGQLIEGQPEKADLWLLQANAYVGLNQPLKAAEIFELVDHLGNSSADSLNMLADIYVNEELYELAAIKYIGAIDKNPASGINRAIGAAKVLAARGAFGETRMILDHIESHYGEKVGTEDHKDLLKLRARLAVADGSGEEEVRVLEEIVELDPLDGEALILLGRNCARNGDSEKAIFYYERAGAMEAFEAEAKVCQAQVLIHSGKYDAALPLLRRAQQINPRENVQEYLEQVERIAKSR